MREDTRPLQTEGAAHAAPTPGASRCLRPPRAFGSWPPGTGTWAFEHPSIWAPLCLWERWVHPGVCPGRGNSISSRCVNGEHEASVLASASRGCAPPSGRGAEAVRESGHVAFQRPSSLGWSAADSPRTPPTRRACRGSSRPLPKESDMRSWDQISFCMLHKALEFSSPFCLNIFADKNFYKSQLVDHLVSSWHLIKLNKK